MNDITVTPAEIVIPAGELESAEVTWTITDDLLLTTADPETHTLVVTASAESEDPVVVETRMKTSLLLMSIKYSETLDMYLIRLLIGLNWLKLVGR